MVVTLAVLSFVVGLEVVGIVIGEWAIQKGPATHSTRVDGREAERRKPTHLGPIACPPASCAGEQRGHHGETARSAVSMKQ
jgi:hypothetical protein